MSVERRPYDINLPAWFWSIIDQLRAKPKSARKIIGALTERQMVSFYNTYREATDELCYEGYDEERWEDEDEYHYACCWIVNQGQAAYRAAWNDPSLIPKAAPPNSGDWSGLVSDMCQELYGRELCG